MNAGRNAPCPCGSGRKFKHCCLPKQNLDARSSRTAALDRLRAAASSHAWEVDVVPMQVAIETEPGARVAATLVCAGDGILHSDTSTASGTESDDVAELLADAVRAAAEQTGTAPTAVLVRFPELVQPLARRLKELPGTVGFAKRLENLEGAARSLMEHVAGRTDWPPISASFLWSSWQLPHSVMAALYAAAAAYWRAAPWHTVDNEQVFRVVTPSDRVWTVNVLGSAGEEFGLAIYSNADDFFTRVATGIGFSDFDGRMISLTYSEMSELESPVRRATMAAGLEIASPDAVPFLFTVNTPAGMVSKAEAADLTALLHAVPRFVAAQKTALRKVQRGPDAARPFAWTDAPSGFVFEYDARPVGSAADFGNETQLQEEMLDIRRVMQETIAGFDSDLTEEEGMQALHAALSLKLEEQNRLGRREFGGLSPVQVRALLDGDWESDDSAVTLRSDLHADDLAASRVLANARVLLEYADRHDGLPLTQAGNLKLNVVRDLLDVLNLEPGYRELLVRTSRRILEADVEPLHTVRVLAELAGLIRRRGARFVLTGSGRKLLGDQAQGRLQTLLFRTRFREMNLAYGSRGPEWPELQTQAAFSLYRLQTMPRQWATAASLQPDVVLPFALESLPEHPLADWAHILFEHRLLRTLDDFGLLEADRSLLSALDAREDVRYRTTPLMDMVVFRLSSSRVAAPGS